MSKFSRLGASALALALSIALVSPVTVSAMTDVNKNSGDTYTKTSKETGKTTTWSKGDDEYDDELISGASDFEETYYNHKKERVQVGEYTFITVPLSYGQVSVSKVKIKSGKDIVAVKVAGYEKYINFRCDEVNEAGTRYIVDPATGERIKKIADATDAEKYKDYGIVKFRIYGKKIGDAVIQYQVNDAKGNKVATRKMKISVGDTGVKSVKFAGKEIYADVLVNRKANTYFSKKSGKLKVTMNKGYALKSIYVITDPGYEDVTEGNYKHRRPKTVRLDLNGDGDCLDTIDGIEEKEDNNKIYTKVKNGKKIKLGSQPSKSAYLKETSTNELDGKEYQSSAESLLVNGLSTTKILIIYQDKLTKDYLTAFAEIERVLGKK